jgi:hypothetical protein
VSTHSELPRKWNSKCDMIKMAFEEDSMSCTQVFEWFRCFKEG